MMKVTNCFMSKGILSRARAMFNSVMANNSCRVVLIALVMHVCGSGSLFAQLATGDTITIRYNDSNNYLAVNNDNSLANYSGDKPTIECLWIVTVSGSDYSFESVSLKNQDVTQRKLQGQNGTSLQLGGTGSPFGLGTNGDETNVANQVTGRFYYYTDNNSRYRFIQYNNGWRLTDYRYWDDNWNRVNYTASSNPNNTLLLLEKWTRKVVPEGLSGEFTSIGDPFGLATTDSRATKTVQFTITRTAAEDYLYCVNRPTVKITQSTSVEDSPIELEYINFLWSSSNNAISKTTCANYEDETVMSRNLLQVSHAKNTTKDNTWDVTVTALGSSPMDLKNGDGDWINYTDNIVASFREKNDAQETTYRVNTAVERKAYHKEVLPSFVVNASPNDVTLPKTKQDNFDIQFTVTHQRGVELYLPDGSLEKTIYEIDPTLVTTSTTKSFALKNLQDQSAATWVRITSSSNDGKVSLAAEANTDGIMRTARLVGTFIYTNPDDATDTHTDVVEVYIVQNAKDGDIKFFHQMGVANTEFGKNPYTFEDEQLVHVAEKTLYYLPGDKIQLDLPERDFRGYKRWYDYQTGGNPQYNANPSDRTTWATSPLGTNINNTYGDSYGIYDVNNRGANNPIINGWADGKAHIIACDVSNYTDYTFIPNTTSPEEITEPTLSYRQLFHLRPAKEMADKFQNLAADKYLEEYYYTAPVNKDIYLATEFQYETGSTSDKCYFYYDTNGNIQRVTNASWIGGAEQSGMFGVVNSQTTGEKIYTLTANDGRVRIAKFTVNFVNNCGPTKNGITGFKTRAEIDAKYDILEEIDFNFGETSPSNADNATIRYLNRPLPWDNASYGYAYQSETVPGDNRGHNGTVPYWGEYCITNRIDQSYATGTSHTGYALYVDGTEQPGLVAMISTKATICSGQTLYCSAWFSNPANANTLPVFRCNVQGRAAGDTEWEDVGVFFVGSMSRESGWHQVVFPVLSQNESYEETRVSIYNFATSNSGNDFMVDDICLFVSPLPLAAYQATMGCRSYTDNTTTSTAVVVRLDYAELNEELQGDFAYYQIFNVTDNRVVKLKTINASDQIVPAYYAEAEANEAYGSVRIPAKNYTPNTGNGDVIASDGLQNYIEGLIENNTRHGKCYVKDAVNNKWFLYVIHIVPNTQQNVSAADADIYLAKDKEYLLRIAHDPDELDDVACASTTELHATTDTYVELRDDQDAVERVDCKELLCANNHYFLDVKVQNTLATSVGGTLQTVEALVHADWLVGAAFDDLYCNSRSMTDEQKATANTAFTAEYKCERNALRQAISDMRQVPSSTKQNPNYQQADPTKLTTTDDFDANELALVQRLCAEGKLKLYQTTSMFYMGSEEVVRYWIYPVAEDAKVTFNGQEYKLYDCDEPLWVRLKSQHSEYAVNLSPIDIANQKPNERLMLPSIRILEGTEQVTIPVKQLLGMTNLHSTLSPTKEEIVFNYKETIENVLEYVDLSNNRIDIVGAPTTLEPGKDYLMRMAFYDKDGYAYIGGDEKNCRVGFVYFYLSIVPNVVQWTGEASAVWGDDANWKARKTDGTLMDVGFAPLPETNVIIPTLLADKPYPIVTTDDHYPMDVNHLPNACNDIYFAPGAMIHNQHLLQYNRAFVDMTITPTTWNSMAPPLKGMYTGDMYVPHSGNWESGTNKESTEPFVVNSFDGARTSSAAYAFWQSIYNKRVPTYHENGNQSYPAITEDVKFVETNSLGHPLTPGTGYQVLGYGPGNISGDIIVRLPKPDTYYSYYYSNGTPSDQGVSVTHSPKLAFEPDANGDMYITLTNALASNQFMFGNPAMANIDMEKFLIANPQLAKKYYTMSNSSWTATTWVTIEKSGTGKLAPMRSVLLELASGTATSVTVKLSKSHFVGYTEPAPASLSARRNSATEESDESMLMTIYATNTGGQARCMVAAKSSASDIYESQEDALFISSGVEQGGDGSTATSPINMYTVSKQVPMMVDVRANIDTVPLSMLVLNSYRTKKVKFAFYLSLNWNKECYFWDSKTDEKFRILDGLWLELDMPENYETRYFILGPDDTTNDDISSSTDRPVLPQVDTPIQLWAYSAQSGQLQVNSNEIIQHVKVYDLTGRLVAQQALDLYGHSMTLTVPTGMCIVEATMRDNTTHYTQAIVR